MKSPPSIEYIFGVSTFVKFNEGTTHKWTEGTIEYIRTKFGTRAGYLRCDGKLLRLTSGKSIINIIIEAVDPRGNELLDELLSEIAIDRALEPDAESSVAFHSTEHALLITINEPEHNTFGTFAAPLVVSVLPSLISNEIVSIQPLKEPTTAIFNMNERRGKRGKKKHK